MVEYKVVPVASKTFPTLEKQLNKLAAEGWEVAVTIGHETGDAIVMERVRKARADTSFYDGLNRLKEVR